MKSIVIDKVKGRDLPLDWAERADVRLDEEVQVAIGPSRETVVQRLFDVMDRMSEEAKRNGLTERKLTELLKDD